MLFTSELLHLHSIAGHSRKSHSPSLPGAPVQAWVGSLGWAVNALGRIHTTRSSWYPSFCRYLFLPQLCCCFFSFYNRRNRCQPILSVTEVEVADNCTDLFLCISDSATPSEITNFVWLPNFLVGKWGDWPDPSECCLNTQPRSLHSGILRTCLLSSVIFDEVI